MKKFYFKVTTISRGFGYSITFVNRHLSKGEQGDGRYVCLLAKNEKELSQNLRDMKFDTLTMVDNPVVNEKSSALKNPHNCEDFIL